MAAGCSGHDTHSLDMAESVMDTHSDSALSILRTIDPSALDAPELARYALLHSQALDKNYIDEDNDSLINLAYRYYLNTDDQRHKMLACYYYAVVNLNAGNTGTALSAALQAENLAISSGDVPTASLTQCIIGIIFSRAFNHSQAIAYHKLSLDNAKRAGKSAWQANQYNLLAGDYISAHNFDSAKIYLDSARIITGSDDPGLRLQEFLIHAGGGNDSQADSVYRTMIAANDSIAPRVHALAALANFRLGKTDRYAELMSLSEQHTHDWYDSIDIAGVKEKAAILQNDYNTAYHEAMYTRKETSRIFNRLADSSLFKLQIAHEQLINEDLAHRQHDSRNTITILTIILVCTIISAVSLLMYIHALKRRRAAELNAIHEQNARIAAESELSRQQSEMKIKSLNDHYQTAVSSLTDKERALHEATATLEALREMSDNLMRQKTELVAAKTQLEAENRKLNDENNSLNDMTASYSELEIINSRLENEILEINNRISRQEDSMRRALKNQYEWIDRLTYLRTKIEISSAADRDKYIRDIDSELKHTRTRKFFDSLQKEIDETRNNLISRIKEQCRSLDENDIMLISYFCIGMTTQALEVITGKGSNVIYKSKSRIKSIIRNEAPEILAEMADIFRQTTR